MDKAKLIILLALFVPTIVFGFPGESNYETFPQKMKITSENNISNSRETSPDGRRASENKRPWYFDTSFLDMELNYSPRLTTGRPFIEWNQQPPVQYVLPDIYGCNIFGPYNWNFFGPDGQDSIKKSFDLDITRIPWQIKWYKLSGPAKIINFQNYVFTIKAIENLSKKAEVNLVLRGINGYDIGNGLQTYEVECSHKTIIWPNECECTGAEPTIYASDTVIDAGGSITLYVDSGKLACPPFTWEVNDAAYSITSHTYADLETATLTADAGTCGVEYDNDNITITVTVTDNCGKTDIIKIRNTEGYWGNGTIMCNDINGGSITEYLYYIVEDTRYTIGFGRPSRTKNGACDGSESQTQGCNDVCAVYAQANSPYSSMLAAEGFDCARRNGSTTYCDEWLNSDPISIERTGVNPWVCSE